MTGCDIKFIAAGIGLLALAIVTCINMRQTNKLYKKIVAIKKELAKIRPANDRQRKMCKAAGIEIPENATEYEAANYCVIAALKTGLNATRYDYEERHETDGD